jgi:hypothetical protein
MLGAATEADMTAAPMPASTAARTASLEGNSSATRSSWSERLSAPRACSKPDRVGRLGPRQNGARLSEEQRAGLSQLDAAADPVEKLRSMPPFQHRDRGADRRLSNVERLGGARDMLAFRDGDKDPELFERHSPTLSG